MITRIDISQCNDFLVRWYYSGWHYWSFISGVENFITSGETYRTEGKKLISISSGQINFEQCEAIKTILLSNDVSVYQDVWYSLRIDPVSVEIYNSQINGYEINLQVFFGRSVAPYVGHQPPVVKPLFVSAYTSIANDDQVRVNFDRNLDTLLIPDESSFILTGRAVTITNVSIVGKYVLLDFTPAFESGDVITVEYTKPASNPLTAKIGGGEVDSFNESVTNNVGDVLLIGVEDFVTDNYADYFASGVELTSLIYDLIFEALVVGTPFVGASSINNVTGDVDGTLPPAGQTDNEESGYATGKILCTGSSGTADVTCKTVTEELSWDTNMELSLANFITDYSATFSAIDITIDYLMEDEFSGYLLFYEFGAGKAIAVGDVGIVNTSGDLYGNVSYESPITGVKQKTTISVTGTSGTALITVNDITRTITV
jgi:hypothetical protein